eukprot:41910-Eustigmatos_ZCMA.PRE.1
MLLAPDLRDRLTALSHEEKALYAEALERRNGSVVPYSPLCTGLLRCSTSAEFLGAGESARAALFYLVKYMIKDAVEPSACLSIIRQVRQDID